MLLLALSQGSKSLLVAVLKQQQQTKENKNQAAGQPVELLQSLSFVPGP